MAYASFDSDDGIHGINVTPLVDIMLVLLIVFMIATRLDQPGAIDVQLPRAATATEVEASTLAVVVHRDGTLHLNGVPTTLAEIQLAASRGTPDTQALVAGDQGVEYERIVAVMDALRRGGVYKLALPTAAAEDPAR
jgi:biopolymer transport protein ExbD